MNITEALFDKLTSASWRDITSTELEIGYLHLQKDCISTSTLYHQKHPHRFLQPGPTWLSKGDLPHYFDPGTLQHGLEKIATGKTDTCRIPLTHYGGNTDTDHIQGTLKDEALEIAHLSPGKFELRKISKGRTTARYRRTP